MSCMVKLTLQQCVRVNTLALAFCRFVIKSFLCDALLVTMSIKISVNLKKGSQILILKPKKWPVHLSQNPPC